MRECEIRDMVNKYVLIAQGSYLNVADDLTLDEVADEIQSIMLHDLKANEFEILIKLKGGNQTSILNDKEKISLKEPTIETLRFETMMKVAIEKFLEESGFNDKTWVTSLKCSRCGSLCTAFTASDTDWMFFKCDKCKHVWQLVFKPLGYDLRKTKKEESPK